MIFEKHWGDVLIGVARQSSVPALRTCTLPDLGDLRLQIIERGLPPHPQPSPSGRGRHLARAFEKAWRVESRAVPAAFSLSPRERAGVRGKCACDLAKPIRIGKCV